MSSLGGAGDFIDFGGVTEGMPGLGPIASQSHYLLFIIYFLLFIYLFFLFVCLFVFVSVRKESLVVGCNGPH